MVTTSFARAYRLSAAAIVLAVLPLGGPSGCLINPKNYPLGDDAGSGDTGGQAGAGDSQSGNTSAGRGGAGPLSGRGGDSHAGSSGTGGTTPSAAGGASNLGGTGGDMGEVGGEAADNAGGAAGTPPEQGGSAGEIAGHGGVSGSGGSAGGGGGLVETGGSGSVPSVKRVFVTAQMFNGNFKTYGNTSDSDGLKGANAVCNDAASQAGLGGTWVAWLSVTGNDASNRVADVAPWYLIDQTTKVFETHAQLGSPASVAVNVTENGETVSGRAWTGTTLLGTAHSARCGEWKNAGTTLGAQGDVVNAFDWSYKDTDACSTMARLYCFEQ